jgi:hypothetical protein
VDRGDPLNCRARQCRNQEGSGPFHLPQAKMGLEILHVFGAILLFGALIWGANSYRGRRRGEAMVGDQKTRELYTEERYRS